MRVHRVGSQHGGDHLVSEGGDTSSHNRSDRPLSLFGLLSTDEEDDISRDRQEKSDVAQPQPVLGCGLLLDATCTGVHPDIRHHSAQLLTKQRTNDQSDELQSQLLGIQLEFALEQLRDLHRYHHTGKEEHHRVCHRSDEDRDVGKEGERVEELRNLDRRRIDPTDRDVLALECGDAAVDVGADISGFRSKEDVQDELACVDLIRKDHG